MHRLGLPVILLAVSVGLVGCATDESAPTPSASAHRTNSSSPTASTDSSAGLAGAAVVTVSSEDTAAGNIGTNAIDGDPTTEWATGGAGAGSTILLEWDAAQELGSIVLADRASTDDHVEAGTLTFSDGSTVMVPALPDDGEPIRIEFAPRSVTSVLFAIDEVGPDTTDIGLSEIDAAPPQSIAALLGVERVFADADGVVRIRPRALATVDETDGIRLVRVELEIEALAGTVEPTPSWFTMLGADATRYAPVEDPADDLADPIGDALLEAGDTITGTVHFEIPSNGSGFLIGYTPDPDGEPLATWSLNAP